MPDDEVDFSLHMVVQSAIQTICEMSVVIIEECLLGSVFKLKNKL